MSDAFFENFPPKNSRAHEVCGSGALAFATTVCGTRSGPVLWAKESWQQSHINPAGFATFCDPNRLVLASGKDQTAVLATAEEALRSGALSVVVAELNNPVGLTQGRRLQLAAEAGKTMGIFIISDGMGSNATETRWRCTPLFDPIDSTLQRWELIKNKSGTFGSWIVRWDAEARRVIVVSKVGK